MSKIYRIRDNNTLNLYDGDIITILIENAKANIHYNFNDVNVKIFIFNNAGTDLELNDNGSFNNCDVEIKYMDLNHFNLVQNTSINFYENCHTHIYSTYLGIKNKHIVFDLANVSRDAYVEINNNIVALDGAIFEMEVIGKILENSFNSKHFQKTHCLTMGIPKKAKILPVLEIDNNEVEASHSLSSGTIDEEVLFYINTRGLSQNEALSLLLESYLLPSDEYFDDYECADLIKELSREKVKMYV